MSLIKITVDQIVEWNGDDVEDLANYLASILNRNFDIQDARAEILSYHDVHRDED